jgi:hypothetical protein
MARTHAYLRQLVSDALERSSEIEGELARRGAWTDSAEWRISTVTDERIEPHNDGFVVSSTCDAEFTAVVANLEQALQARSVFWGLHADLFYSLGWPSWAGYMRLAPDDPPRGLYADDAEPYLAELVTTAAAALGSRMSEIEAAIEAVGRWEEEQHGALKMLLLHELYPEVPPEATEPVLPEVRFEARVERGALTMRCFSPTPERAAQFLGIFEKLSADLVDAFGWTVSSAA